MSQASPPDKSTNNADKALSQSLGKGNIVVPGSDPDAPEYLTSPGGEFDGVVNIFTGAGNGTGVLLEGGRYVLTAAHVAEGALASSLGVNFDLAGGRQTAGVESIYLHPDYVENGPRSYPIEELPGYDIAVLELSEPAPTAAGYSLYRDNDEVGQSFIVSGYGLEGTGASGSNPYDPDIGSVKRWGMNTYDALDSDLPLNFVNAPENSYLLYDFDNGSSVNDTLGNIIGSPHLGLGQWEVMAAPGDSGGPSFIEQADGSLSIAGLVQGGGNDSMYGATAFMTRASYFSDWVDGITGDLENDDGAMTPEGLLQAVINDLGLQLSTAQQASLETIFAAAISRNDDVALSMLGGVAIRSALEAEYGALSGPSLGQAITRLNDIVDQVTQGTPPEPTPTLDDHGDTLDTATVWPNPVSGDDSVSGSIETQGDVDVFEVHLDSDYAYTFDLTALDSSLDTYLTLFDAGGDTVVSNDDGGPGLDSRLNVTVDSSATYYLEASAYSGTGDYTLNQSVSALSGPEPTPDPTPAPDSDGFDYTLNYLNGGAMGSAFNNIDEGIRAALDYWGQFIDSQSAAEIDIDVTYDPIDSSALASAGFTYSVPTGNYANGYEIYNSGVQHELTTGLDGNGSSADAVINIHSSDLSASNWWYDPTPMDRTDNMPGASQLDFMGVMLHEFGHALGFVSSYEYTSAQGFNQPGDYLFTMDEYIDWNPSQTEFYYTGPNSEAAYAAIGGSGPVPIYVAPDEPGSSFSHYGGRGSEAGLLEGYLMNPSVSSGQLLDIAELDLAFLEDMGYSTINQSFAASEHDMLAQQSALTGISDDDTYWLI